MIWLALLTLAAHAEAPPVFTQDPLCAQGGDFFREELAKARPLHLKYPQFRELTQGQDKWFGAVTGTMKTQCEADAKFALELRTRDRSALTGQCKPAAEAALADQEVLEHSEASLKTLKDKREEFVKGSRTFESLPSLFARDYKKMEEVALDLLEVPPMAACEIRWIYPQALLKTRPPIICAEAPPGVKLEKTDAKDSGVFAQLLTRFELSYSYNVTRRNAAKATADASRARYESCVAQYPGTENVLVKAASGHAKGAGEAPKGAKPTKGSDITGTQEDAAKRKK